jgi:hypothetical protein
LRKQPRTLFCCYEREGGREGGKEAKRERQREREREREREGEREVERERKRRTYRPKGKRQTSAKRKAPQHSELQQQDERQR